MSDTMLFGVLRMPYDLAMSSELSRQQFYARVQEAADELERLQAAATREPEGKMDQAVASCASGVREQRELAAWRRFGFAYAYRPQHDDIIQRSFVGPSHQGGND